MPSSQHAARFGGQNAEGHFQSFNRDFEVGMGIQLLAEQAQAAARLSNVFHSVGSLRLVRVIGFIGHAYILAQRARLPVCYPSDQPGFPIGPGPCSVRSTLHTPVPPFAQRFRQELVVLHARISLSFA